MIKVFQTLVNTFAKLIGANQYDQPYTWDVRQHIQRGEQAGIPAESLQRMAHHAQERAYLDHQISAGEMMSVLVDAAIEQAKGK